MKVFVENTKDGEVYEANLDKLIIDMLHNKIFSKEIFCRFALAQATIDDPQKVSDHEVAWTEK